MQQDDRFNDCLFNCIQRDYFQKNFNFVNFLKSIDANVHYTNQTKNQSLFALVLSKIDSDMHFDSDQQYFNVLKDCLSFFVSKGCSLGETYNNLYGTTKTVKEIVNQIKDRSFGATFANKIDEMMIEIERLSLSNILNQPKKAGKNLKI